MTPTERVVADYGKWLAGDRGLSPSTVRGDQALARRFLTERASSEDPRGVSGITAGELNAFLLRECGRVSAASAGCYTTRLRSLLCYLAAHGPADPALAGAVPRVARWRDASVPRFPRRVDIERLLASCDTGCASGALDYAVLLLLAVPSCEVE